MGEGSVDGEENIEDARRRQKKEVSERVKLLATSVMT